ncbi:MAG: PAS domain S-box protein [Desulfobulbaceae bacterium]|nr:PAS domain S-box protein [Desulfobulbaceae bacterium]HIJ78695.1 PAS domain-containing protein [Deltaproteobacteria bacterium]
MVMDTKNKVIFVVTVLMIALSGFHLYAGISGHKAETARLLQANSEEFTYLLGSIRKNLFDIYSMRLRNIAEVRTDIVAAFAARDREKLLRLTAPTYQDFREETPFLDVMHFHEPNGKSFLRMHKPDFFGDDLRKIRPAAQYVHQVQKQVAGFEIGRYGAFFRVIQPVFYEKQYVGLLEVGILAEQLAATIVERFKVEVALYYNEKNWQKATLNKDAKRKLGNQILVYKEAELFRQLPDDFDLEGDQAFIEIDGKNYIIHRQALLKNYHGESIGGVIALQDITFLTDRKNRYIWDSVLFTTALLVASWLVLYFSFGRLIGALDQSRQQQKELIGELTEEVAERKRVGEALRASETKLKAMLTSLGDHITMVDKNFRLVWANENAWGRDANAIIGRPCYEVVGCPYGSADQQHLCPTVKAFADWQVHEAEILIELADGSKAVYHCTANPALLNEDQPTVIEIFRDISLRRKAEAALESLHHRYGLLLDAAGAGIYDVDMDGNTTFANAKTAELTGFAVEEIVGHHQHDLFHHTKKDGSIFSRKDCPILQSMIYGEVCQVDDDIFWRKDGTSFAVEYVSTPVREGGQIVGAVVVFKDISERKNLEGQLLQAQKMEAVGRLAGGVAHDFNNQLTAILGYAGIIKLKMSEDEPLRRYVEAMIAAATSASGLTRQLLTFSRKQVLEMQAVDLGALVSRVSRMIERVIGDDIQLQVQVGSTEANIMADPIQIEQIIMNLAINAKDAMPMGGTLLIEASTMTLDSRYARSHSEVEPGRYAMLIVADSGTGIPAGVRDKMFEPFFTTKDVGKGTGLGLAMVHGIVKQHNGHIYVYSELGKGTTFKIFFPIVEGEIEDDRVHFQEGPMPRGRETVLVVDDDESIREMIGETLEILGYRVLLAASGDAALNMVDDGEIDLLLTDYVMPGISGWDIARSFLAKKRDIKVILMSGYSDKVIDPSELKRTGVVFIHKPFAADFLAAKVREVLNHQA